jgi:putative addiction module killer protein
MADIVKTAEFDRWLRALKDTKAKAKILIRIDRLALGNPGDVQPVGEGISEMRIHDGPGYRVYYKHRGETIVLLFGGDKSSQSHDINRAKTIAGDLED